VQERKEYTNYTTEQKSRVLYHRVVEYNNKNINNQISRSMTLSNEDINHRQVSDWIEDLSQIHEKVKIIGYISVRNVSLASVA
jgi:hypothetical protein